MSVEQAIMAMNNYFVFWLVCVAVMFSGAAISMEGESLKWLTEDDADTLGMIVFACALLVLICGTFL